MSDSKKPTDSTDEAPTAAPPAVPAPEGATTIASKDDIPAADADVKEGEKTEVINGKSDEKIPVEPKDPKEDPVGWINSLLPAAVHKVNYHLLDWIQKLAIEEEDKRQPLPGKNGAVTKNQFLGFLRDGTLLAKTANRLQPGAIEKIVEGDESKQKQEQCSNIEGFLTFVKEKVGLTEQQCFKPADLLEKGKTGYLSVFNTIMQLGYRTQNMFEQQGIDSNQLVQLASQVTRNSLIQSIINFFRKARPTQTSKELAKEAEEKEKAEKAAAAEKVVEDKAEQEVCKKMDAPPASAEPPAVAAN